MITFEPLLAENCLSEIAAAGPAAQSSAQTNLGIGTPIVIQSSHITPTGSLALVLSNGTTVTVTGNIIGAPGQIGPGFSAASINSAGHLIVTNTAAGGAVTGTTDLGNVVGAPGSNGSAGQQGPGFSDISINSLGHLIVTTTSVGGTGSGTIDLGNVVGTPGDSGPVGPGFSSATINGLGHLIVTNTAAGGAVTGTTDLGNVVGTNGTNGTPGSGYISAAVNSFGHLILGQVTAGVVTGTVDLGSVVGPQGPMGSNGGMADASTYGVTGNGTTDDTAAFNAAVATGKPVLLEPGSYRLSAGTLSGTPRLVMGYGITLPLNGFAGVSNQGYWNGQSGLYISKFLNANVGQATLVLNAVNNQPAGTTGESATLYASMVTTTPGANATGLAGIFQASAGAGNTTASICTLNTYAIWGSGTQGSGGAEEVDVVNSTGTDDVWPVEAATMKGGHLYVSQGTNRPSYAWQITATGAPLSSAPFQVGGYFWNGGTARYDLYAQGNSPSTPRWYVDSSGNIYAQTMQLGTFNAAPALAITTGVGIPTSSANPGSVYINTNQSIPSIPQLYLNTSVGSAGVTWGQIPVLNQATTFSVSLKGHILSGAENVLDDGAGNATIVGSLTVGSNAVLTSGAATAGGAIVTIVPSGSPYVNTALARGVLFVNGGAVTSITIKRGTTAVPTGQTSGGISVVSGDQVSITYTSIPTVNFVPA